MFDLAQYFSRIRYTGPAAPTLGVLRDLVSLHTQVVPFENLDVLRDRPIDVSDDGVFDKIVLQKRGGYSFEQNGLFLRVLTEIGFHVTPHAARVRIKQPRSFTPPRTHLFLKVVIDGVTWLADVGIGGLSPVAPLRFELDIEQPTTHESRRIIQQEGRYFHQAKLGEDWADVYEFTGEAMPLVDRVLGSWYCATHPESRFRSALMVARALGDGTRYAILNNEWTHRRGAKVLQTVTIGSAEQLLELLREKFDLHFAPGTRFGPAGASWTLR